MWERRKNKTFPMPFLILIPLLNRFLLFYTCTDSLFVFFLITETLTFSSYPPTVRKEGHESHIKNSIFTNWFKDELPPAQYNFFALPLARRGRRLLRVMKKKKTREIIDFLWFAPGCKEPIQHLTLGNPIENGLVISDLLKLESWYLG